MKRAVLNLKRDHLHQLSSLLFPSQNGIRHFPIPITNLPNTNSQNMLLKAKEMEPIRHRSNPKPSSSNQSSERRWIEVHLYRHGRGPISIIRSSLVGPGLDRLDVRSFLSKYGLRSLYAFKPPSERGFRIRFDKANGLSVLRYKPGSVVFFDSEPKGSLTRTVSLIFMGLAIPCILITVLMNEFPYQFKSTTLIGSFLPPWLLAFGVILFSRMRKKPRT